MSELAVVLCTHNPEPRRFERAVAGLQAQSLVSDSWSLVVVDNASEPAIDARSAIGWHANGRVVCEPTLGLTYARLCGIRETFEPLLVFVDDDNVLAPDYLSQALAVARRYPFVGAWSGQSIPEFEAEPPPWARRYWGNLALRTLDEPRWSNLPDLAATHPFGCGLCVRRQVADRYFSRHERGERKVMLNRCGKSLLSGGDQDLATTACGLGMGTGLFPELVLTHLIPAERMTRSYHVRLARGIHYSSVVRSVLRDPAALPRKRGFAGCVADVLRGLCMSAVDRQIFWAAKRGERDARLFIASGGLSGCRSAGRYSAEDSG